MSGDGLVPLSDIEHMLSRVTSADEALKIADFAEAARVWLKKSGEASPVVNRATLLKALAERRFAEYVDAGQAAGTIATVGERRNVTSCDVSPTTIADLGTNRARVQRARKLLALTEEEIAEEVAKADADVKDHAIGLAEIVRKAKSHADKEEEERRKAEQAAAAAALPAEDARYRLLVGDLAGAEVAAESIDCIITDPPYPAEFLPEFDKLGEFAARTLRPGAILVCMVGQSYLPEIMQRLTAHVRYHWTAAYLTPGGQAVQLWQRKVNTFWKPLLLFTNGDYTGDWVGDVCRSDTNDNDKRFHHWGQSESGMVDIVTRFSKVGDTVCDPFCGGGATAVASLALDRQFVGIDIDASCITRTRGRIAEVLT